MICAVCWKRGAVSGPSTRCITCGCVFIIFEMGFNMKHLTTTVFAAAALLMGAHAHAAMVETWSVDIEGLWTAQGPAGVTRDLGDTRLRWGTSTGFGRALWSSRTPCLGSVWTP